MIAAIVELGLYVLGFAVAMWLDLRLGIRQPVAYWLIGCATALIADVASYQVDRLTFRLREQISPPALSTARVLEAAAAGLLVLLAGAVVAMLIDELLGITTPAAYWVVGAIASTIAIATASDVARHRRWSGPWVR